MPLHRNFRQYKKGQNKGFVSGILSSKAYPKFYFMRTMKPTRLIACAAASDITIIKQEWYEIFSSTGNIIP